MIIVWVENKDLVRVDDFFEVLFIGIFWLRIIL